MCEKIGSFKNSILYNNNFLCNIDINGCKIKADFINSFFDNIERKTLSITFYVNKEQNFIIEKLENLFLDNDYVKGNVSFFKIDRYYEIIDKVFYSVDKIEQFQEPVYDYSDNNISIYYLTLHYSNKFHKKEDKNKVLTFEKTVDQFKKSLIGEKELLSIDIYKKVTQSLNNEKEHSLIVCSRACGMTTHLLAYYLAKITTNHSYEVWFLTPYERMIYSIFDKFHNKNLENNNNIVINKSNRTISNTLTNSKIRFMSICSNIDTFFVGKKLPNAVVYDDMAFMKGENLKKFMDMLDIREKCENTYVKEVCVSTPSIEGSIFNFLAIISDLKIEIPWYLVHNEGLVLKCKDKDKSNFIIKGTPEQLIEYFQISENNNLYFTSPWFEKMKEIIPEKNIKSEFCCYLETE